MAVQEFVRTYKIKIMLVAFIGIQVPIITLIFSTFFFADSNPPRLYQFALIVVNAVASSISLILFDRLLSPILLTANVLSKYLQNQRINHLPVDFNRSIGDLLTDTDIALQRLNEVIQHLSSYDLLTGLPNRALFKSRVQQTIDKIGGDRTFAIIVLDLDSLKDINSTWGREVGNMLLVSVAQRLTTYLNTEDILARFGGSDFALLCSNAIDRDSLIELSRCLLDSFTRPFSVGDRSISCAAKIGITIYPLDGLTVEQLLQNADTAIYQTSQQLNTYQFYHPSMTSKLKRTLAIKENLRHALDRNELYLHYQPRIEIATGRLAGVEALLRWQSEELGAVSPAEFIPIAETTDLIMPIGEWVLRNACLQNRQWQKLGIAPSKISVNLSTCQFKLDLIDTIDRILDDTNFQPTHLELEITESLLVEDLGRAVALLSQLKQRGISIALDDFGTGYSSLKYLQKLPIDTLKIDRCFVANIASNSDDAAISKAIVALAQSLKLNITAEGVETEEQFLYLQNQGCHEVQGYYFSKPFAPEMLSNFFSDRALKQYK